MPTPKMVHIVDDDASVRDSIGVLLESFGIRSATFESAGDYLASGQAGAADCVLLDLHMPGMTGLELLERLRALGITAPVIVMTANGDHIAGRIAAAGASSLLCKPFDDNELVTQIEAAYQSARN